MPLERHRAHHQAHRRPPAGVTGSTHHAHAGIGRRRRFFNMIDGFRNDFRRHQLVRTELLDHRLRRTTFGAAAAVAAVEAAAAAAPPTCSSTARSAVFVCKSAESKSRCR